MKKKVAIVFGGRSVEHDVSVITGLQVLENIDKQKYDTIPIYIDKKGKWFTGDSLREFKNFKNNNLVDLKPVLLSLNTDEYNLYLNPSSARLLSRKVIDEIDIVFPTIHGVNGEDGTIQGVFELINIPYVGGGIIASSVGMDKIIMKDVFKANDLPIVDYAWFYRNKWFEKQEEIIKRIEEDLGYPLFVKPANLGSSIGISKAKDRDSLIDAIEVAIRYDRKIIVEKAVENAREINCAVLGYDDNVLASLCEEPLGWKEILTFEDKYIRSNVKGAGKENSRRIIPADINDDIREKIEKIAIKSFIVIDGRGNSRVDFLIDEEENIYINEINTLPGSIAFYLWEDKGYPMKKLIDEMINIAIKVHEDKNKNMYTYEADLFNKVNLGSMKIRSEKV
ncbi:D-alanine--D-alanine ligase [Schnuerera sp. xch1]|uniref:D-alanine--D-alanine ligase family protein n=1 Tax=Schnuerera sp. xch1 TaxID=2874283 RepID=UPI001CC18A76|nr:D-alanine--D-alanine ligase family protein [Schnuerera sp. xch1]MBZ2174167.1 D-alanine--D-alanine ligase [Schnuerera sp. xch1]